MLKSNGVTYGSHFRPKRLYWIRINGLQHFHVLAREHLLWDGSSLAMKDTIRPKSSRNNSDTKTKFQLISNCGPRYKEHDFQDVRIMIDSDLNIKASQIEVDALNRSLRTEATIVRQHAEQYSSKRRQRPNSSSSGSSSINDKKKVEGTSGGQQGISLRLS